MPCCSGKGMMTKEMMKEISIQKEEVNGKVKATVKITSEINGQATTEEKVFEGTEAEVQTKIDELRDK
jgi:K(+)-stimulated pyrophosphate-energized sodium pump